MIMILGQVPNKLTDEHKFSVDSLSTVSPAKCIDLYIYIYGSETLSQFLCSYIISTTNTITTVCYLNIVYKHLFRRS